MRKAAVARAILGLLMILAGGIALTGDFKILGSDNPFAQDLRFISTASTLLHVSYIVAGIGVMSLQAWARKLAILAAVIDVSWFMGTVVQIGVLDAIKSLGWIKAAMLILGRNGLILWYFLRPSVKVQFVKSATSDK